GTLTVSASTFAGNSASHYGGIFNSGTLTVSASTFTGNNSATVGGGIRNGGTLTVTASTFTGNSATNGAGGIDNNGTATLNGTIGVGTGGGDLNGNNVPPPPSFNLVGSGGGLNNTNGNQVNVSLSALPLAPLGNSGGPTQTIALLPGSLAIGSGPTLTTAS